MSTRVAVLSCWHRFREPSPFDRRHDGRDRVVLAAVVNGVAHAVPLENLTILLGPIPCRRQRNLVVGGQLPHHALPEILFECGRHRITSTVMASAGASSRDDRV